MTLCFTSTTNEFTFLFQKIELTTIRVQAGSYTSSTQTITGPYAHNIKTLWNERVNRVELFLYADLEYIGPELIHKRSNEGLTVTYRTDTHALVIEKHLPPLASVPVANWPGNCACKVCRGIIIPDKSTFSLSSKVFHMNLQGGLGFLVKGVTPPLLINGAYLYEDEGYAPLSEKQIPNEWLVLHHQYQVLGRLPSQSEWEKRSSYDYSKGSIPTSTCFTQLDLYKLLFHINSGRSDFKANPQLLKHIFQRIEVTGPQASYSGPLQYLDLNGFLKVTSCKLTLHLGIFVSKDKYGFFEYDSIDRTLTIRLDKLNQSHLPFDVPRLFSFIQDHGINHIHLGWANSRKCDCHE